MFFLFWFFPSSSSLRPSCCNELGRNATLSGTEVCEPCKVCRCWYEPFKMCRCWYVIFHIEKPIILSMTFQYYLWKKISLLEMQLMRSRLATMLPKPSQQSAHRVPLELSSLGYENDVYTKLTLTWYNLNILFCSAIIPLTMILPDWQQGVYPVSPGGVLCQSKQWHLWVSIGWFKISIKTIPYLTDMWGAKSNSDIHFNIHDTVFSSHILGITEVWALSSGMDVAEGVIRLHYLSKGIV